MTEREELLEQIEFLHWRKAALTLRAGQVEDTDPELADHYDSEWNAASDEVGRLQSRLYEIEAAVSRREFLADATYGRSSCIR